MKSISPAPLTYEVPFWDARQWSKFLLPGAQTAEAAVQAIELGERKVYSFSAFALETFHRLYSCDAVRLEAIKPENQWAVNLHNRLSDNDDFNYLRDQVGGSYYSAGLAATTFLQEIVNFLPEPEERLVDPQPLREQVLGLKKAEAGKTIVDKMICEGKAAVAQLASFAGEVEDLPERVICAAAKCALKGVIEAQQAMQGFGWGLEDGDDQEVGKLEEKFKLAQSLLGNEKLKRIALEAGRLKRVAAKKQKSKSREAKHSITGIEAGNNLSRLLPSQYLSMSVPQMRPLFAKAYSEKSLLQYEYGGKEIQGRGPIVICIDSSGSMEGSNEVWAKAVALTLLGIANSQKRHCRILHYSASVRRTDDFPVGKIDQNRLLGSMKYFSGGGTNWEEPLDAALECIKSDKNLKGADICFLTDGACQVGHNWLEVFKAAQKEHQFAVYGVVIGSCDHNGRLARFAEPVISVANLQEDDAIAEVFGV